MKKLLSLIGILVIGAFLWTYFLPKDTVFAADTDYEAAQVIMKSVDAGKNTLCFTGEHLTEEGIFRTLESLYPYAFSIKYTTYQGGKFEVTVVTEDPKDQTQGIKRAKELAAKIVKPGMTVRDKLGAIHNYIILHCTYDLTTSENPQGSGNAFTAAGALLEGKAVCAGYSRAFTAICREAGIDAIYIADEKMNHGWNAVRIYGQTYYIDCTYDDPVPDRPNSASVKYFCRTAEQLKTTHQWDQAFYDSVLDAVYPSDFQYIQRMMDLGLISTPLGATDTEKPADAGSIKALNLTLGTSFEGKMTFGKLYLQGWEALSRKTEGLRLIDRLISSGKTTLTLARKVGL